jgi:hypothetical protein
MEHAMAEERAARRHIARGGVAPFVASSARTQVRRRAKPEERCVVDVEAMAISGERRRRAIA